MSQKIRSIYELEDYITVEYSWRRKEMTNIVNEALFSRNAHQKVLLKAAILIIYSHWEGFIKNIARAYCKFLNSKRLKYSEVKDSFCIFQMLDYFEAKSLKINFMDCLDFIIIPQESQYEILKIDESKYIKTRANLNSKVLKEMIFMLHLDYSLFELKENFIDDIFLHRRHAIAHGDNIEENPTQNLEHSDLDYIYTEVIILIDIFKNQIINAANIQSYKK